LDKAGEEEGENASEIQEPCSDYPPPDSAYGSAYSSPSSSISPYPTRSPNLTPAPSVYAPSDTDPFSLSTSPGTIGIPDDKWHAPINTFCKQNVMPVVNNTKLWNSVTSQEIGGQKGQIMSSSNYHALRLLKHAEASTPKQIISPNISPNIPPYNQEYHMYNYPQQNFYQIVRPVATIKPVIKPQITVQPQYGHRINIPLIKPEGVIVQQVNMKERSIDRIQRKLDGKKKTIEWVKACRKSNFFYVTPEGKT
jgi:hypothetical protein